MNRRHPEITDDRRMKCGGEEKIRRGEVLDTERGRKYAQQKKVDELKTVVEQSPKLNVEISDKSAPVSKELSSHRFLVQLWQDDPNHDNISSSVNYRRFVDKIEEEDEDAISISDIDIRSEKKRYHAQQTEISYSNSENSFFDDTHIDTKKLYKASTKMASTTNNAMNGSRSRHHSKTHHSRNSRRPGFDDDMKDGPTSMIIMNQHHMTSNNNGVEDSNRTDQHNEQHLYSLQPNYGQNSNNRHDGRGNNHHRHGGHKHRSNSHVNGERKQVNKRNHSSDNNISDPEKHLMVSSNSGNNSNDNSNSSNYKPSNNGVFSSKSIKQANRHMNTNNVNDNAHPQHPISSSKHTQQTYKSSKPTTMAELNAKRSKYQLMYVRGQMICSLLAVSIL